MAVSEQNSAPVCLFVGQVPKNMAEHDFRAVMEKFGPVDNLNVIKDHATGLSKGCAFVTYRNGAHASAAQAALHGQTTLPGASNPLQVSPARQKDTSSKGVRGPGGRYERQEQRKLFIGMVSRTTTDEQLRSMLEPFGRIEDCIILRNADQSSKGCAFVSYSSMEECQKAILALNNSQIMAGCTAPLVVRFADTPAQKEERQRKRIETLMQNPGPGPIMPANSQPMAGMGAPQPMMGVQQPVPQTGAGLVGGIQNALAPTMQQLVQQQQQLQAQQQAINQALQMLGLNYPNGIAQGEPAIAAPASGPGAGPKGFASAPTGSGQPATFGGAQAASFPGSPAMQTQALGIMSAAPSLSTPTSYGYPASAASVPSVPHVGTALVGNRSGPEGANLFIYHLPETVGDHDLVQMFAHYGTILSAKVFTDKGTGLSKGFGFVSYDNASSAQTAIQAMNGFQVGPRRIKVQLKKSSRPY